MVSHSYQTYFNFPGSDLNLDCGLRDHVITRFASLWFTKSSVSAAELNLELKPQANNIKISSNLTYDVISPLIDYI
jgi:hypothetical protein